MSEPHRERPHWLVIDQVSHPKLYHAFEVISHDSGAGAGHTNYCVPADESARVATAEAQLTPLTDDEIETLSIGEAEEMDALVAKHGLADTHALFNEFFEGGWPCCVAPAPADG